MKEVSTMIPNNDYNENGEYLEEAKPNSSLPSRSEVHRKKKKKSKRKIKFPLIKLLVLFFILLPIVFYYVFSYLQSARI